MMANERAHPDRSKMCHMFVVDEREDWGGDCTIQYTHRSVNKRKHPILYVNSIA